MRSYTIVLACATAFVCASAAGMATSPMDVPDSAKNRFGQVGPGNDENHLSHTVKFCPSVCRAGRKPRG